MRLALCVYSILVAGCAGSTVRFADRAILWDENDALPIPMPRERRFYSDWVGLRDAIFLPVDRALGLDYGHEAENANALDEIGDSTWFRDPRRVVDPDGRVWWRPLGAERMTEGPMKGLPHPTPPFTVTKGKTAGLNAGFQVRDANGQKWMLKFDHPGYIGLDTSTEAVTTRIVWSLGWNVPAVEIVDLSPEDLRVSPTATVSGRYGDEEAMDAEWLGQILARIPRLPDEKVRALASRWLEGRPVGPGPYFGRRDDDPNDRVPHEDRRDLVGQSLTLGLMPRDWQGFEVKSARAKALARWPELGFFDVEHFDPKRWTPVLDNPAFVRRTRRDAYWGAKRVGLLEDDEIEGDRRGGARRQISRRGGARAGLGAEGASRPHPARLFRRHRAARELLLSRPIVVLRGLVAEARSRRRCGDAVRRRWRGAQPGDRRARRLHAMCGALGGQRISRRGDRGDAARRSPSRPRGAGALRRRRRARTAPRRARAVSAALIR
jgi:hypothetical protein